MVIVGGSWARIYKWMIHNEPAMLTLLSQGASEQQIQELEEVLETDHLPDAFKACYRYHNGALATTFFGGVYSSSFFSISEIIKHWRAHREEHDLEQNGYYEPGNLHVNFKEIKRKLWTKGWIPFGRDASGNELCLDLEPTDLGTYGQVIHWRNSTIEPYAALLGDSFTEYLVNFANDVENGRYALSEDGHSLIYSSV